MYIRMFNRSTFRSYNDLFQDVELIDFFTEVLKNGSEMSRDVIVLKIAGAG